MLAKNTTIKSSAVIKFQTETNKKINNLVRAMEVNKTGSYNAIHYTGEDAKRVYQQLKGG
jgi:hypothetical protein